MVFTLGVDRTLSHSECLVDSRSACSAIASYFGCAGTGRLNGSQMNYDLGSRLRLDTDESIQQSEGRNAG